MDGVLADPWPAPTATSPIDAIVQVPGSKSMTNRALVLAALADGRSIISAPLRSRDSVLMAAALRKLGAAVDDSDEHRWIVDGGLAAEGDVAIHVGNAGTVLRFVPPLASLTAATVSFDGDAAARRRPVGPLLDALRRLGADVTESDGLPFTVRSAARPHGGPVEIDATSSSQLVSALLLAGPRFTDGVVVRHVGARGVPNAPHIAMTVAMLRQRGVTVDAGDREWAVQPGTIGVYDELIEPDLSSAAPFLAAAVVTGGTVRVPAWPATSTQPGALLPQLLEAFGATWQLDADGLVLAGRPPLAGATLNLRDAGELTPVVAAVAALAESPSRLVGIDYLRGHETDRLAALAREINRLGGKVAELADGLEITPKPLHGGAFSTYDDHRLAMAAAVLGLVVPGLLVQNVATTSKTFPGFVDTWNEVMT